MATYRQTGYEVLGEADDYDLYRDGGEYAGTVRVEWRPSGGLTISIEDEDGVVESGKHNNFARSFGFENIDRLVDFLEENRSTTRTRPYATMVLGGAQ
jgi:two-component sensor histidine kinase